MLKLQEGYSKDTICVDDMQDGDVGIIKAWASSGYVGRIVQRHANDLVTLGIRSGEGWRGMFNAGKSRNEACRVRLLKEGETLIVA